MAVIEGETAVLASSFALENTGLHIGIRVGLEVSELHSLFTIAWVGRVPRDSSGEVGGVCPFHPKAGCCGIGDFQRGVFLPLS